MLSITSIRELNRWNRIDLAINDINSTNTLLEGLFHNYLLQNYSDPTLEKTVLAANQLVECNMLYYHQYLSSYIIKFSNIIGIKKKSIIYYPKLTYHINKVKNNLIS